MNADLHPIISCEEAKQFEEDLFGRDEDRAWDAMVCAGAGVAGAIEDDFAELGGLPAKGRLLVLVGKGHNGGDALLAAAELAQRRPGLRIEVWFVPG